jgi:hypothetical protein
MLSPVTARSRMNSSSITSETMSPPLVSSVVSTAEVKSFSSLEMSALKEMISMTGEARSLLLTLLILMVKCKPVS